MQIPRESEKNIIKEIERKFTTDQFTVKFHLSEIPSNYSSPRLDVFVQGHFTSLSREYIKNKIQKGEVKIKGRSGALRPSTKIRSGDEVTVVSSKSDFRDIEAEFWRGQKLDTNVAPAVLYEDESIVVCSKPAFMATHPTGKHLFNCANLYFEKDSDLTYHPVHRLDRETSGILVLAKSILRAQELTKEFEESRVKKVYFLISKVPQNFHKSFPLKALERLGAQDITTGRMYIDCYPVHSREGKAAETTFEMLFEREGYAFLLAYPRTGRQHQIRCHAAHHDFPILGDKLYNGDSTIFERFKDKVPRLEDHDVLEIPRQALHSIGIQLTYKGEKAAFISAIPEDLLNWGEAKWGAEFRTFLKDDLEKTVIEKVQSYFAK